MGKYLLGILSVQNWGNLLTQKDNLRASSYSWVSCVEAELYEYAYLDFLFVAASFCSPPLDVAALWLLQLLSKLSMELSRDREAKEDLAAKRRTMHD